MYFSVLPLLFLLLFASSTCASPIHTEHRSDSVSINRRVLHFDLNWLEDKHKDKRNNPTYKMWDERWEVNEHFRVVKEISFPVNEDDPPVPLERMKWLGIGEPKMLLKTTVWKRSENILPVKNLIDYLHSINTLVEWGWNTEALGYHHTIIFIMAIKEPDHAVTGH